MRSSPVFISAITLAAFILFIPISLALATQITPEQNLEEASQQEPSPAHKESSLAWEELAPGLNLGTLENPPPEALQITILRIDPAQYEFFLQSSSLSNADEPQTISAWMEKYDFLAATNASMYLPDGQTSTAYMRRGSDVNNGRIATSYGGFFVASPKNKKLPFAAVLDKHTDDWESLLPEYDIVIQNMRLLGSDGAQLWPENGPMHAVAAIGQDKDGHILFLHCSSQVNVHKLVNALLASPTLNLATAIYVEGGSQTALGLSLPSFQHVWTGRSAADILLRGPSAQYRLPNIIGIRARKK